MNKTKWLAFGIFLLILGVFAYSQSITLTAPNGGENWVKGSSQTISWISSGISDGTYTVILFRGTTKIGAVKTGVPCADGSHSITWVTGDLASGGRAPAGTGYLIKVRQAGKSPNDFSDQPFTISDQTSQEKPPDNQQPEEKASIKVLKPGFRDEICWGTPCTIQWEKEGNMNEAVSILLYRYNPAGHTRVLDIVGHTVNNGTYNWVVPSGLKGPFLIFVKTVDNLVKDFGRLFKIKDCTPEKPADPCLEAEKLSTDLSIERVTQRISGNECQISVYIKNKGPRCVSNFWLEVKNSARKILEKKVSSDFWGDGRSWVLTSGQTMTYNYSYFKPTGNPKTTLIDFRIYVIPYDRNLNVSGNDTGQVLITW